MGAGAIERDAPTTETPRLGRITGARMPVVQQDEPARGPADDVDVDVIPSSPPPEVLDEIAAASEAYDRLAAAGQHLSFGIDASTGRVQIALQDQSGRPISGVTPSDALRLAAGGSLD